MNLSQYNTRFKLLGGLDFYRTFVKYLIYKRNVDLDIQLLK